MLESSDLVAFVAATDLDRARLFYEQTLCLRVLEHNDFAVVLDANGTMLRVTAVGTWQTLGTPCSAGASGISEPPCGLSPLGVSPSLRFEGMSQDDHGIWTTSSGDKVAWFADPGENTLSLTQFGSRPRP
jgi:catechol 2,3-dioxygenase-like lactoylglutathione lyase family enzyme